MKHLPMKLYLLHNFQRIYQGCIKEEKLTQAKLRHQHPSYFTPKLRAENPPGQGARITPES